MRTWRERGTPSGGQVGLRLELAWLGRAETPCEAALLWAAVESVDSTSDLQYSHPSGWTSGRAPFVFLSPSASEIRSLSLAAAVFCEPLGQPSRLSLVV